MFRHTGIAVALACLLAGAGPAAWAASELPSSKRTQLGKYLSAKEAFERITTGKDKILFLDVRGSAEVMFVGGTDAVDAVVPFVEMKHPLAWDEKSGRFALVPNAAFIPAVDAELARKGLGKADTVVIMCRSGERSARAADALAASGYTNAWSVHDGFEGDLSPDGRRSVNGWKNAGLPWSFKLDRSKFTSVLSGASSN